MSRKNLIILIVAFLTAVAGAIWADCVPTMAGWLCFLEMCAGFGFGVWFNKAYTQELVNLKDEEIESVKKANRIIADERTSLKAELKSLTDAQKAAKEEKSKISKPIKKAKTDK